MHYSAARLLTLILGGLLTACPRPEYPAFSDDLITSVMVRSDGKILALGPIISMISVTDGSKDKDNDLPYFTAMRLNIDGSVDKSLNGHGKIIMDTTLVSDDLTFSPGTAMLANDKVLVVREPGRTGLGDSMLFKLGAEGEFDTSLNTAGWLPIDLFAENARQYFLGQSVASASDGSIAIGGTIKRQCTAALYKEDGTLDEGFNKSGFVTKEDSVKAIVRFTADNKVILGCDNSLYRFLTTGALDTTFGTNGVLEIVEPLVDFNLDSQGRLIVVKLNQETATITAYTSNGILDETFGTDGDASPEDDVSAMAITSSDEIIVINESKIRRYTSNGQLDTSFGSAGIATLNFSREIKMRAVAVGINREVVVGGSVIGLDREDRDYALARLTDKGVIDTSFGREGYVVHNIRVCHLGKNGYSRSCEPFTTIAMSASTALLE